MKNFLIVSALALISSASAFAVQLTPETVSAFDRYIAAYEAQRFHLPAFLASEETAQHREQLLKGEVVVFPGKNNGDVEVPSGLIHDWVGAIFVPGANLDKVLTTIKDYGHQSQTYAPDIAESRLESHQGNDDFTVFMKVVKSKFMLSDVLNTEHKIRFTRVSPERVYCKSYSTRVAELSNPGTKNEHELPVGNDRGFLWRMYGYWFFEQKDNGVYVEYESISLSRDVPLMGKLIGPVLHSLPAESLRSSMEKTRKALEVTATRSSN
jgi:hypothetical protein